MKFLCDRCKTRYSIADERVRGKVLKIRCKSCSHVITVREGMTDEDPDARASAAPAAAAPAPAAAPGPAEKGSALADAFAQVMQPQRAETEPPPPALEEEWYVSLDGNQQGPFNLQDAQKWVAAKKHDDELYCWSEGFDDWLPVDKVSHFRGLRPKLAPPPPKARPPAPGRAEPRAAPSAAASTETPQPLFAATLAALEAEVEAADAKTARKPGDGRSKAALGAGAAAKAGGLGKTDKPADARSNGKGAAAASPTAAASAAIASLSPAGRGAGARFDLEGGNRDEPEPELEDDDDRDEDQDDLEIGEVSRVVRLPDLMAAHQRKMERQATSRTGQNAAIRTPAPALGRGTGGVAALAAAAAAPDGSAAALDPNALPTMADALAAEGLHPLPQPAHKHTTLYIFGGLGLVLLAFALFVVIKVSRDGGEDAIATGDVARYDSLGRRIDDPQRRAAAAKEDASGKTSGRTASTGGTRRAFPTNTLPGTGGDTGAANPGKTEVVIGPDGQPLLPLTVDDVLQVSSRMSSGTRRCYERALKDDPFLKVSKITIDLTVEATGVVSNVTLDRPGVDTLNKCLSGAIKRWPFRRSTKQESFRFPLVFEQR